jgi:DNA-directed RNA polymerase specialized sigma subunit
VILTQQEIAYVCGCSVGYIYYLEKSAKEKLRREFERRGVKPNG